MSEKGGSSNNFEEDLELRRGPWTLEEDTLLIHYIVCNGEGRWNLLAKSSGLKRTGKSCRLRWLNYLKPDVKRGNLSPEEQLLILELHSKWGNRWSRIAQHLPGRTDNEIKNYWRTRVEKQARQLKIEANSVRFRDVLRCYWMPRLLEKISFSQQYYSKQKSMASNYSSSCSTDHHPNISTISAGSATQVANFQEEYSFHDPSHVLIRSYDQFESSSTYHDQYRLSGGGNQSPCSNSSVITTAAPPRQLVPSSFISGFQPSPSNELMNNVTFNPRDPAGKAYNDINIQGSMGAAPVSAASEYTVTAMINNCTDNSSSSSSSSTGGDVLWNIDELFGMLPSSWLITLQSDQDFN